MEPAERLPGAVGVEVGGGRAGEGGLEGGIVVQIQIHVVVEVEDAAADVDKMKKAAEAEGYKLLVNAFGSPRAYNLYTFAENFQPESIRLFYAGEGTFWTDLSRFEEAGAAKLLAPPKEVTKR